MDDKRSRYELVSRRALLKASAGFGVALVLPSACGSNDAEVFAGAVADPVTRTPAGSAPATVAGTEPSATAVPTTAPLVTEPTAPVIAEAEPTPAPQATATAEPTDAAEPTVTAEPTEVPTAAPEPTAAPVSAVAVAGEMVVSFTYTQVGAGKNERPYIAVWIENEAGELAETVSLWYQQGRRGERWLDHLDRWWERDQNRIVAGGVDDAATISSATRSPGSYAVAWDGTIDGVDAPAGSYFICIESAREEGPYSLIREPLTLVGTLPEFALPDTGELSAATVRIDV